MDKNSEKNLVDSINELTDITSRLDERVNGLEKLFGKEEKMVEILLQLEGLKNISIKQEKIWSRIFGFVIQLAWVLLAAYLLYKLGLQPPPV